MQQRIWIVRHGNREDFGNPGWAQKAERPYDPALSPDGEIQAQEVAAALHGAPIQHIFASPFLRTMQTAHIIAETLDLPVKLEPGIGEILPAVQETPRLLSPPARRRRFPRIDSSYAPSGRLIYPEKEADGLRRAADTVLALARRLPQANLLLITHAAPVVGIVRHLSGMQEPISVPLCGLFVLERNGAGWKVIQQGDVSHLSDQSTSLRWAHKG